MPKRVLVVDDTESILLAFSRLLACRGFGVDCARELEEAEALAATTPYDVVITDLSLQGAHGQEGLEIVRFLHQQWPQLPVIVLTAHASQEVRAAAAARGAVAFVEKTCPLAEVVRLAQQLSEGCP